MPNQAYRLLQRAAPVAAALLMLTGCAHSPAYDPDDPLERINRPIFAFNMKADKYVLRPVAKTYADVVPDKVRLGISNFFDNLFYPTTIVNDLLQGKFAQSGKDTLRFVMNSTIGLAGFIDVASTQGLTRNDEDLGQTLGHWGVGQGWYLMLPLLGPSTNRDLFGFVGDNWAFVYDDPTSPLTYIDGVHLFPERTAIFVTNAIDDRSKLLGADKLIEQQLDPYVFFRTAYLQQRESLVYDGNPPQEEFEDFDE
jgi:phospholipid-binding lipoprotein MlaA